ncbi:hypothetical protein [Sinorhizobium meliloti]|uniref:hypothetical protein n=1 Tax=Rhizobium meliloti TaxID=382 RepID=UPI0002A59CE9|nr:hypothetical protein C770_GR4pB193 [Sinorhizobium meliloti GR4]
MAWTETTRRNYVRRTSGYASDVTVRRDNQLGNSVNLDGSVARGVTEGGRSPTGGTFLATARTHIGVHAVW